MPNLDTRTTKTPAVDDYTYLLSNDGTVEGKVELQNVTVIPETTRTINFTSSQTATQIQADIDAVGKYIPKGVVVTFQFANGTYTLDNQLLFQGFYGGGRINIQGDTAQSTSLHNNQNVHLDFSTGGIVYIDSSVTRTFIKNLRITAADANICLNLSRVGFTNVWYCYLANDGKTSTVSRGVHATEGSHVYVILTYFSNNYYGIFAGNTVQISSSGNDDTGTQPNYGLRSEANGTIGKLNTQPTGSTANESLGQGGNIF